MGMTSASIDVVVVTHNSSDVIKESLLALAVNSVGIGVRTWVVDNASTDGCSKHVRESCGWVATLDRGTNDGFGAGCNIGAGLGEAPMVLFLNPDCILGPETLRKMWLYLRKHPKVAAVGPAQFGGDGQELPGHQAFPSVLGELERTFMRITAIFGRPVERRKRMSPGRVDWISGACMLVRRSALEAVGPFDERFFLYFEETDWCRRAAEAGFEIHHHPGVSVTHIGGTSVRRSASGKGESRARAFFRESRRKYFCKHHGTLAAAVVEAMHRCRRVIERLKPQTALGASS